MDNDQKKLYVVMLDVHDEHGRRKLQFPKEIYDDRSRAMEIASSLNGRNLGDRVTFANVVEVPYFPTNKYSINQF